MATKRFHYDAALKRQVIVFAEEYGNRAASRHFNINETNVRRWRNNRTTIFLCKATTKGITGPKQGKFPQIDNAVIDFVKEQHAKGLPTTKQMIQIKGLEIAKKLGVEFKGSQGWCRRLLCRGGFLLGCRTSINQKLPTDFEQKLIIFQKYIIQLRKKTNYDFSQIGNANETCIHFDMPRDYIVNENGQKGLKLVATSNEKQLITVMLCITADGQKLPPYVIFARKRIPKNEKISDDVIVRTEKKGWMTADLMKDWVNSVWNKRPGFINNPSNMLVLAEYSGHLTEDVKNEIIKNNTDLVIIPKGMTSILQPLDVSVIKTFRGYLRKEYELWLMSENHPLTPSGEIKKGTVSTVAKWVSTAWKQISDDIIKHSFKKCCITNALDGSEDDLLWEDEEDHSNSESESNDSIIKMENDSIDTE